MHKVLSDSSLKLRWIGFLVTTLSSSFFDFADAGGLGRVHSVGPGQGVIGIPTKRVNTDLSSLYTVEKKM